LQDHNHALDYKQHQKHDVSISTPISDSLFVYKSKINTNVGSIVNSSITEIATNESNKIKNNVTFCVFNNESQIVVDKSPTLLKVVFDNDIFSNTDYYYTNGVYIELISPLAGRSPLSRLLVGIPKAQVNLFGFSLMQNIYTPTNPDIAEISIGDRPFSAFLTIGQTRESYDFQKNFSVRSSINFGVIGPASMGGVVQSTIHDIEPIGWNNQIRNNIVLDYSINLEKGIVSNPRVEFNVVAGGNIGTIFNNLTGGFCFRVGSFLPTYRGLSKVINSVSTTKKLQFWFFAGCNTNLVFYDATLQGGMFSNNNSYVISSNDINRLVLKLKLGFAAYYNNIGLELHGFYLSPEFKNAYDFRWGRVKLVFQL